MPNTQQYIVEILGKDKTGQAFKQVQSNADRAKTSILNLKNILISLGAGAVLKSFVNVGKEVENLQIRFKFLFGSAQEGSKAFDTLTAFAGKVPFSLEQISRASGNLAVVSKDANDLNRILEITGNVAAVTGLDFETTASQIQRAFSGGIAAADIFREKGIRQLLGFKEGAKVTVADTVKAFEEAFSGNGRFAKATDDLAQTLEGTLSMIGDKYFQFQKDVAQGFFDELKSEFGDLNKALEDNKEEIKLFANAIGTTLATAIVGLGKAVGTTTSLISTLNVGVRDLILDAPLGFGIEESLRDLYPEIDKNIDAVRVFLDSLLGIDRASNKYKGETDTLIKANELLLESQKSYNNQLGETITLLQEFKEVEIKAMEIKPMNVEDDIFKKLKDIRDKTGVGLIKQIKHQQQIEIDALKEARDLNLLSEEEYLKQREKLNLYYSEKIKKAKENEISQKVLLEKQGQEQILGAVGDALSKLSGINKNAFKAYQAFQIAMATVNTFRAVSNALATYPFPLNIGVAAAETVRGLATVAQIKSVSYSGRALGGKVDEGKPYLVGEQGAEMFVPNQSGTIIPNNKMGNATNVNITINANDTQGFDDLLVKRRSVIVNVINDALNSQGREALI